MSRDAMLAKIRTALGVRPADATRRQAVEARLGKPERHLVPARGKGARGQLVALFQSFLREQGTALVTVQEPKQVPAAIAAYLRAHDVALRLRRGSDAYLAALPWGQAPELELDAGPAQADDSAGLSRAISAVAETGTLVLASGPDNPVTLAFLPETHLVVVRAETIVGSYEEACALLEAELGRGVMPRTLNLITGASRTGDIGGRIVKGAHGPRRLAVFLVAKPSE